jgi:DeoD family purine-nucleoside phosphorylase
VVGPGGSLRLEEHPGAVPPDPASALLDLGTRTPLEERGVATEGVHAHLLQVCRRGRRDKHVEVGEPRRPKPTFTGGRGGIEHVDGLARPVVQGSGYPLAEGLPELRDRAFLADHHPRVTARRRLGEGGCAGPRRHEVRPYVAERNDRLLLLQRHEPPEPAPGHVLEEHALDGLLGTEGENVTESRALDETGHGRTIDGRPGRRAPRSVGSRAVPIHVRAEPGDYAEACLLPGDPLRAQYIAENFLDDVRETNRERGMLGYTGAFRGRPVSVQSTGMGCPSAAIVFEELVQLGVKRLLRVGTCGGLQPDLALGDLIVALSAVPADGTARHYTGGEPHAPTADWELVHSAVHSAKKLGKPVRVGPIVSSDVFYDPDKGRAERWSSRGILGVEMEAAVLFTLGALRKVQAGCLLTVSDIIVEGDFTRISDEELQAAVVQMTELALATVTGAGASSGDAV